MGASTIAKLTSNPDYVTIAEGITTISGFSNVKIVSLSEPSEKIYKNDEGETISYHDYGHFRIHFDYINPKNKKTEKRSMYGISNYIDSSKESSVTPFIDKKYTYLSLGNHNGSVEIMKNICSMFGGVLIPNDCADEEEDNFFEIINSKDNFVIDSSLKELYDSLSDMNTIDKYNFVKIIEKNKEAVFKYLKSSNKKIANKIKSTQNKPVR